VRSRKAALTARVKSETRTRSADTQQGLLLGVTLLALILVQSSSGIKADRLRPISPTQ
jgi:hypothetical protein